MVRFYIIMDLANFSVLASILLRIREEPVQVKPGANMANRATK